MRECGARIMTLDQLEGMKVLPALCLTLPCRLYDALLDLCTVNDMRGEVSGVPFPAGPHRAVLGHRG